LTKAERARLDQIAYDVSYYGDFDATQAAVVIAVSRLPAEVAEFVFDRCRFLSVGRGINGMVLPGRIGTDHKGASENVWLILLHDNALSDYGEAAQGIVAHEIAHAWLRHDRLSEVPEDCEIAAAQLARDWGFTGRGANVAFERRQLAKVQALNAGRTK
jgi:hypothetical protein